MQVLISSLTNIPNLQSSPNPENIFDLFDAISPFNIIINRLNKIKNHGMISLMEFHNNDID